VQDDDLAVAVGKPVAVSADRQQRSVGIRGLREARGQRAVVTDHAVLAERTGIAARSAERR
jgi:hypothetical protein